MNLKKLKSVQDHGTHFAVDHADHGVFRVAKKGLDHETAKKIQALCMGGKVQALAKGGEAEKAPEPVAALPVDPLDVPNPETGATLRQVKAAAATNPELTYSPTTVAMAQGLQPVPDMKDTDQVVGPRATPLPGQTPLESALGVPHAAPAAPGAAPADTAAPSTPPAAQPAAPEAPKAPSLPGIGGQMRAIDEQSAAGQRAAEAGAAEEMEKQKVWQEFHTQAETRQKAFEDSMKAQDAEYKRIQSDIASSKINPNRMWQNMSTGNKVLAAISMALGGIAQGVNGGPNQAVEIIQDSLNKDIDAQKADLGKKQSLLADNLRKTGDMREAETLTRAQMLAGVQGQLNAVTAKYGGDKLKAQADLLHGQLDERKAQLAYNAALLRANTAGQQNQQAQLSAALQRYYNHTATPADEAIIGDKMAEMHVNTPTGGALAHSPKAAEDYRKMQTELEPLRDHIRRLNQMGEQMRGSPNVAQSTRQKFEEEREATVAELGHLAGLNRLTDPELDIFKKRIRNMNDPLQGYEGYKTGLQGVARELEDKFRANSNALLRGDSLAANPKG